MMDEIIWGDVEEISKDLGPRSFEGKRVLVTGGAGFLGSYLCDTLINLGAYVTCVDNFSTGTKTNINHMMGNRNFTIIDSDISYLDIEKTFEYIFHLASRASPENYQLYPIETLTTSSLGSHKVLEWARMGNSRILFASTSEVYGSAEVIPTPEEYWGKVNPIGVRSCYDEGKRFSEALFMAYWREYGLDVRIVRIHNTYGPRIRADGSYARALPRFVLQSLRQDDITIYGDGSQTRSFCYVSDTIRGILAVFCNEKVSGQVFNVGNDQETKIIELAQKINDFTNSKSRIVFIHLPEDDPKRRKPDLAKIRNLTGWYPKTSLDEGLRRTIGWIRQNSL